MYANGRNCLSVVMKRKTGRQTKGTERGGSELSLRKKKKNCGTQTPEMIVVPRYKSL